MNDVCGTLYVVATPIGNLDDITNRALSVLRDVDRIICEDTRVTKKLLFRFEISKPLLVLNIHTGNSQRAAIINRLADGEDLALVTDAGTPAISDPGGLLIEEVVDRFGDGACIVPIPGPSALAAALSIAGVPADRFFFAGYPPHKKGRKKFFTNAAALSETVVFYESKHRIQKTLLALAEHFSSERHVVIARELTKLHEETVRGLICDLPGIAENIEGRGEFVIVVGKL